MDYTYLSRVKQRIRTARTTDDQLLQSIVTGVSRMIDRYVTGQSAGSDDYLTAGSVAGELLLGVLEPGGNITTYPRKPLIVNVTSFEWRKNPADPWQSVDTQNITTLGGRLTARVRASTNSRVVFCRVDYYGGLFELTAGSPVGPADVMEAADVLAARFYRDVDAGYTDQIGVMDIGAMLYTKAMPDRVALMLRPYKRVVGWSGVL